ncbi:HugZ family protein [Rhizobium tumorigenes]|uniref:Pyridoxamine 5'-phosphate oxidase family protein n=1 Tax=Rhizobium tumorigenes TaxID=2041385 RepID=A0AAF1KCD5_9HYPH|nr:pyridoxamine 5'-phosphate oxidase family protein [Rhizobium tumorigenes]WFR94245.1 pyridoxamine 5'-phosphate oxidase family protein [Rhizobium tumorigenes]
MATEKPISVLRETDEDARRLGRILMRSAPYAAMAVIAPDTGFPAISRVLVGTDLDGVPVILVSTLSAHTKALQADPRASLLMGELGKGDPLAHARLSVECLAEQVARDTRDHHLLRDRFLARHPRARLYIDFTDFQFFRLVPQAASLNGGFGKAYRLSGDDLVIRTVLTEPEAAVWHAGVQDLLGTYPHLASNIVATLKLEKDEACHIYGADLAGFDLFWGDKLLRYEFSEPVQDLADLEFAIAKIANRVP